MTSPEYQKHYYYTKLRDKKYYCAICDLEMRYKSKYSHVNLQYHRRNEKNVKDYEDKSNTD
jgi:hypothetical protein